MKRSPLPIGLVTGASRGLGAHLARQIADLGYGVVLHHRGGTLATNRLSRQIAAFGTPTLVVRADLSQPAQVTRMIQQIRRKFGRLDLLINNAGTYQPTSLLATRPEAWFAGIHSTATATFLTTQAALPLFTKNGGHIVNLGDSAADRLTPRKLAPGYHVGKVGVTLLTRSFAAQLVSRKITVNQISPGYLENSIDLPPSSALPSGRPVPFSEVSAALRYLLSPEASQVTGTNLILSGGWNL
ncbi:MAG: SDR family oxidoreductase [Proteobacteria bacterium]|nr:SDR family oxidoreductase [Pseudomonadota bacterium]NBS50841.1 SDR family oxidoreductase [Verrucomicrobiota bacterium]NBS79254.1 SDR family oxidoreductase [bacterium]